MPAIDSTPHYRGHRLPQQVAQAAWLMTALLERAQRGSTLLDEGYIFTSSPLVETTTSYVVITPDEIRYSIIFDPAAGVYACSCPDCQYRHLPCKHLACLAQNKVAIDAEIAELRAFFNAPAEPTTRIVSVKAHSRTLSSGRVVAVRAYSYTRRVAVRKAVA